MKKNFKSGIIVLIVLIVFVLGSAIISSIFPSKKAEIHFSNVPDINFSKKSNNDNQKTVKSTFTGKKSKDYIAAVYLEGTIDEANSTYNQEWIMDTINSLKTDDKNAGIALFINSPGGAVYQADEVYLALQDYKTTGKKIYIYQGPMAASGGYYISCAGNKIYANRNTLTGSIGVIAGQSYDLTGLFENLGIKSETIHAGKNKNMGNYNEPLTDEQREILQSVADECYDQFTSIVSTQREIPIEKVKKLADGRVYTAKQALESGLIDKIDSWDNMIEDFKTDLEENDDIDAESISIKTFKYEYKKTFMETMLSGYSKLQNTQAASKLGLPEKVLEDMNNFNNYPAFLYK